MKVVIIGGGASGIMAAAAALQANETAEVVILERNQALGRKVLITGGGRCNVTTGIEDVREVLSKYPRGGKFLSSAIRRFPPTAIREFFESRGVPLKTEADMRVFPVSEKGQDIVDVFDRIFESPRVVIKYGAVAERIERTERGFAVHLKGGTQPFVGDRLILATGGQAYRQTGSTGDGYAFAESLGHTVTELHPSLSNLELAEKWPAELTGVSLEKARLTVTGERSMSQLGPFLFTHRGISGPVVFALSALVADRKFDRKSPLGIELDLCPDIEPDELFRRLAETAAVERKRNFRNVLAVYVPKSVSDVACRELGIAPDVNACEVGKSDLRRTAAWLKGAPLSAVGRTPGEEFVTAGGIPLDEVNPSTMESKVCPGLFFCGELLNIDAFTGGFNLTSAWATGFLAGESAVGLASAA